MKKILMFLFAAVMFAACSEDEQKEEQKIANVPDYASVVGMTYDNMIKQYGEPSMNFASFYVYEAADTTKVQGLIFMVNTQLQQVYSVMETFAENAFTEEEIKGYFDAKYTYYGTEDEVDEMLTRANVDEDDDDVYEQAPALVYGNAKDVKDATVLIAVYSNSQVVYTNPALAPEESEGPDMSNLNPASAIAMYMGATLDDLKEDFGDALYMMSEGMYLISIEDNPWLMAMAFTLTDGVVKEIKLLYNEDLTDEEIIAYYEELGYTATDCGADEETGNHVYLFMNLTTRDMFTYSDLAATFMDLSDMGDDEDYDDED